MGSPRLSGSKGAEIHCDLRIWFPGAPSTTISQNSERFSPDMGNLQKVVIHDNTVIYIFFYEKKYCQGKFLK
jgi:hypothetical protein